MLHYNKYLNRKERREGGGREREQEQELATKKKKEGKRKGRKKILKGNKAFLKLGCLRAYVSSLIKRVITHTLGIGMGSK